ncbi:MAG: dihydrofolate reductase [Puniceicoccaceae bacterium]|nr:dihydrofolate reductase [Puniceicoccaceae bacterium]RCL30987.1 MAG: dihydrofolate reductase [Puniceicoccaceae bacterium]|tara:strand:+ start:241 stop:711 length:471 start_codon:yes stop_codon:yes gene_type:complete
MVTQFTYHAIAAMAENRVIGNAGAIPWHLPDDFKWFKKTTMGQTLLMGRKTFESIGRPLPGRQTLILSRSNYSAPEATTVQDQKSIEAVAEHENIWVAGGAEIYKLMLPNCKDLFLTRVHLEPKGDTYFPEFESQFKLNKTLEHTEAFTIEHWVRS